MHMIVLISRWIGYNIAGLMMTEMDMIYCVEDDNSIRDLMVYTLKAGGMEALGFANAGEFWAAMKNEQPELILLDIMLPGEDGLSVLNRLKNSPLTEDIPVILATAKSTEFDKVVGLDNGADDYLAKPFGMMEMMSRVKAVLRRTVRKQQGKILNYGDIRLDTSRHIVTVNGAEVILTLKEFELLKLFMENPSIVFTRDQLLSTVWGTDYMGETRTVDVHIGTLRTKLGKNGALIKTVRGVGYRMDNAVQQES